MFVLYVGCWPYAKLTLCQRIESPQLAAVTTAIRNRRTSHGKFGFQLLTKTLAN